MVSTVDWWICVPSSDLLLEAARHTGAADTALHDVYFDFPLSDKLLSSEPFTDEERESFMASCSVLPPRTDDHQSGAFSYLMAHLIA